MKSLRRSLFLFAAIGKLFTFVPSKKQKTFAMKRIDTSDRSRVKEESVSIEKSFHNESIIIFHSIPWIGQIIESFSKLFEKRYSRTLEAITLLGGAHRDYQLHP